jgi:hypothetical protein
MSRKAVRTALVTLGIALLPLTAGQSANAAIAARPGAAPAITHPLLIPAGTCWKRFGPYATQTTAWRYVRAFRARGYRTSGVWGQGGSIAYSHVSRGYYFRVFYRC